MSSEAVSKIHSHLYTATTQTCPLLEVTDITYIPCREGRLYLASVLDLCTCEIVGWRLGDRMTVELVVGALKMAYDAKKPQKGLIHHSDRGAQYASEEYRKQLKTYRMIASMSRKGNCYDNACIESFHSILKKELIYCSSPLSFNARCLMCPTSLDRRTLSNLTRQGSSLNAVSIPELLQAFLCENRLF